MMAAAEASVAMEANFTISFFIDISFQWVCEQFRIQG